MEILIRGQNCFIDGTDSIRIILDWNTEEKNTQDIDIDVSAFILNHNGKVDSDQDFIFYNQPENTTKSIVLSNNENVATNTGELSIELAKLESKISKIVIALTIYQSQGSTQTFGSVGAPSLTLLDAHNTAEPIAYYQLTGAQQEVSLMMGEIYRHDNGWKFKAIGQGFNDGLALLASNFGVNIEKDDNSPPQADTNTIAETQEKTVAFKRPRRSPKDLFEEKTQRLREEMRKIIPQIMYAIENKANESNTRMILDKIFTDIFEYKMEEVKAEQKIQGRKADYVLSIDGQDVLVVEAKRAGMQLRDKQVFQATSYGAYSGVKWALLTNLKEWQLFYILTQERVEGNLVFSVDIIEDIETEHFEKLMLLARYGMSRKNLLEKLRAEVGVLSPENVIGTILSEEVINKIRLIIKRDSGCNISNERIQKTVEGILNIDS